MFVKKNMGHETRCWRRQNERNISDHIYEGALAQEQNINFLPFVIGASLALAGVAYIVPTTGYLIIVAFIIGAIFSALAGNMGMIATKADAELPKLQKQAYLMH